MLPETCFGCLCELEKTGSCGAECQQGRLLAGHLKRSQVSRATQWQDSSQKVIRLPLTHVMSAFRVRQGPNRHHLGTLCSVFLRVCACPSSTDLCPLRAGRFLAVVSTFHRLKRHPNLFNSTWGDLKSIALDQKRSPLSAGHATTRSVTSELGARRAHPQHDATQDLILALLEPGQVTICFFNCCTNSFDPWVGSNLDLWCR